jgi:MinD-like ATPase involved in chromosome partitioning or flagellar assembly
VNQFLSREEAAAWLEDLADLDPNLEFLRFISFDEAISQAVNRQRPVLSLDPRAQASKSFKWIARQLLASPRRRGRGAASSPLGVVSSAINNRKDTGKGYHG